MICLPFSAFKLTVTDFLLRLTQRKYADSGCSASDASKFAAHGGPHALVSSPFLGFSTLITSAPRSPRSIVQYGPASTRVKSRTRMPCSGPVETLVSGFTNSFLTCVVVEIWKVCNLGVRFLEIMEEDRGFRAKPYSEENIMLGVKMQTVVGQLF